MEQIKLNQITEHVYWLAPAATTDRPILGVVVGKLARRLLMPAIHPNTPVSLESIAKGHRRTPPFLVLTHLHWDHVFGTAAFDVPIIASAKTRWLVAEMADLDWSDTALDQRVAVGKEIEFCRDMIKAEWPNRSNLKLRDSDLTFTDRLDHYLTLMTTPNESGDSGIITNCRELVISPATLVIAG